MQFDAGNEQSAFEAVKAATEKGIGQIYYVFANAGIAKGCMRW